MWKFNPFTRKLDYYTAMVKTLGSGPLQVATSVLGSSAFSNLDSYTKLLLHCNGTNGSTTFTDQTGKTITAHGAAIISTNQSKFGGASGRFNPGGEGTGYISTPASSDFTFGTGDFTIDFWVYFINLVPQGGYQPAYFSLASSYNGGLCITSYNNTFYIYYSGSSFKAYSIAVSLNTWYHIALVRSGTTMKMYGNGTSADAGQTVSTNLSVGDLVCAGGGVSGVHYLQGYIDELRVSKGIARWTSNFTPPSSEY